MYLYYLLGFRLLGGKDETHDMTTAEEEDEEKVSNVRHRKDKTKSKNKGFSKRRKRAAMPLRSLLGHMPPEKYEKVSCLAAPVVKNKIRNEEVMAKICLKW